MASGAVPRHEGFVGPSGLSYVDPASYVRRINSLRGKRVFVAIHEHEEPRRVRQNSLLWAIYTEMAGGEDGKEKVTEAEKERMHAICRGELLPLVEVTLPNGRKYNTLGSTKTLSVKEFSNYIDRVIRFAAENGIYVTAGLEGHR